MPGGKTWAPTTRRRAKTGRPSSLTPETLQLIVKEILTLGSDADAAHAGGIHPDTFKRWKTKGAEDFRLDKDTDYRTFYVEIEKASQSIKKVLRTRVLSDRTAKHALKVLAARWPNEWGEKIQVEDTTPQKQESPRESLMKRLGVLEERTRNATKALAQFAGNELTE